MGNYAPTPEALILIRRRIAERIAEKPEWHRFYGVSLAHGSVKLKSS